MSPKKIAKRVKTAPKGGRRKIAAGAPPRRNAAAGAVDRDEPVLEGFQLRVERSDSETEWLTAHRAIATVLGAADESWRLVRASEREPEFTANLRDRAKPLPESTAWTSAREIAKQPGVKAAEPLFAALLPPPPPPPIATPARRMGLAARMEAVKADCEWSVSYVSAKRAWHIPIRAPRGQAQGEGIVVGHPDTGYTLHPEIWGGDEARERLLIHKGHDFVDGDDDPRDELEGSIWTLEFPSHGTSTASVIMSDEGPPNPQNPLFVTGIAPRARLIPFRVSHSVIHLSYRNLVRAIYAAVDAGCHVISMSLGGPFPCDALERAVDYAVAQGVIVLAAAGNYIPWVVWPAAYDQVICVAASNASGGMWAHSATGQAVDVTAPGEGVFVAHTNKRGERYVVQQSSGTSHAVACVAGIAALWLAYHGRDELIWRYSKERLSEIFRTVVAKAGVKFPNGQANWEDDKWGRGIIDAALVLSADLAAVLRPLARPAGAPGDAVPLPVRRALAPEPELTAAPARTGERPPRMQQIENFFPDLTQPERKELPVALSSLLHVDQSALPAVLDQVGHELTVHLATDPALRSWLAERLGAVGQHTSGEPARARGTRGQRVRGASLAEVLPMPTSTSRVSSTRPSLARAKRRASPSLAALLDDSTAGPRRGRKTKPVKTNRPKRRPSSKR